MEDLVEAQDGRKEVARMAISISDLIFNAAVRKIDKTFGQGYAMANPVLVAQYLDTTAATFHADMKLAISIERP